MKEMLADSRLQIKKEDSERFGIAIGNQFGVLENFNKPNDKLRLLKTMNHMTASLMAIEYGLRGKLESPSMASSTGSWSIGQAYRQIKHGISDLVVAGGLDFNLNRHFFEGMDLLGANCQNYNDEPEKGSMPFHKKRCGPVISDGGGLLLLEDLEHAIKRDAKIYCEIIGQSQNCDAYHILRPNEKGLGTLRVMKEAMIEAQITPS